MAVTEIWLVRHGETEWARTGRHTGLNDIALTPLGEQQAVALKPVLAREAFDVVATSPLRRARDTSQLAGYAEAQVWPEIHEWNYGAYEGRTSAEIRAERPGWHIWADGVEGGETVEQVGERAGQALGRLEGAAGKALIFAHGHFLRILATRWLGLCPDQGRLLALFPGAVSILGYEGDTRVIRRWNWQAGSFCS